ncbi:MAG TPA: hypothetical protein VGJ63_11840 [Micromonosporaceae bacterium]|jgi:hypothetical protein
MEGMNPERRSQVRVEIDLNSRDRDGYVRAPASSADGAANVGDLVTVFEPDDQVAASATVVRVDQDYGYLVLDVHWDTLADDYSVVTLSHRNFASNSAIVSGLMGVSTEIFAAQHRSRRIGGGRKRRLAISGTGYAARLARAFSKRRRSGTAYARIATANARAWQAMGGWTTVEGSPSHLDAGTPTRISLHLQKVS